MPCIYSVSIVIYFSFLDLSTLMNVEIMRKQRLCWAILPSELHTLNRRLFNAVPLSATVGQHQTSIGWACVVRWVWSSITNKCGFFCFFPLYLSGSWQWRERLVCSHCLQLLLHNYPFKRPDMLAFSTMDNIYSMWLGVPNRLSLYNASLI